MDAGLKNRQHIKTFANMINCLAKVGEEVIFDMKPDRVSFVTVNASKSTFARFTFLHSFFDRYSFLQTAPKIVRLTLKNVVHVFKNAANLDQLKITLDRNNSQVIFDSFGLSQVQKIYQINCSPCDVVNPEHDLSRDFEFEVNSSYLSNLLSPFGKLAGDITFLLGKRVVITTSQQNQPNLSQTDGRFTQYYIQMKSYAEKGEKQNGNQTSLAIDTVNLESFNVAQQAFVQNDASNRPTPPAGTVPGSEQTIQAESEMTFSFKDLKALIGFCELSEYNIHFSMTRNRGDPIVIRSESQAKDVEIVFLMATIDSDDETMATAETSTITTNQQVSSRRASQQQQQVNDNQMVDDNFSSGDQFSTPINKRKRSHLDESSIYIDNQDRFVTPEIISNPSGKSLHNQFLNEDMPCASFGINGENERYIQLGVVQSFSSNSSNGGSNEYGVQDDSEGMIAQRHVLSNASDEEVAGTPSPPNKQRKRS
ncbi:predicted protein [Naegleria gruberi]|uniref:Predicted protein n=1 Tax=Naegleria gruberi TaxID=5762 RepID=D2V1Y9_NAEGR|nr:uncharacterized protein NAEGRDRAFT_62743 [Naegleria gruberi]EFC49395.1 predicted protein [Naegleria gruberi]|eukprot:XP_002682139.1 predicted protein [Naegleria gruberi strain NEG-M]